MGDRCDGRVFKDGHAIVLLDGCMHRVEQWVQAVARESGQLVDWHYSGGVAQVLYVGDFAKVDAAVEKLLPTLADPMPRRRSECGSCSGATHRAGDLLRRYAYENAHGIYRAGDSLPENAIAVDTLSGDVFMATPPSTEGGR